MTGAGRVEWRDGTPDPEWMSVAVGTVTLWLERPGPAGPVETMILVRAADAVLAALNRTRGRGRGGAATPRAAG